MPRRAVRPAAAGLQEAPSSSANRVRQVGLQAFVAFYQGLDGGSAAVQPHQALISTAARQMLLMTNTSNNTVRNAWQSYYNGYLDRMKTRQDMRLVGIVKGSWNGQKQYPGSEG